MFKWLDRVLSKRIQKMVVEFEQIERLRQAQEAGVLEHEIETYRKDR